MCLRFNYALLGASTLGTYSRVFNFPPHLKRFDAKVHEANQEELKRLFSRLHVLMIRGETRVAVPQSTAMCESTWESPRKKSRSLESLIVNSEGAMENVEMQPGHATDGPQRNGDGSGVIRLSEGALNKDISSGESMGSLDPVSVVYLMSHHYQVTVTCARQPGGDTLTLHVSGHQQSDHVPGVLASICACEIDALGSTNDLATNTAFSSTPDGTVRPVLTSRGRRCVLPHLN